MSDQDKTNAEKRAQRAGLDSEGRDIRFLEAQRRAAAFNLGLDDVN